MVPFDLGYNPTRLLPSRRLIVEALVEDDRLFRRSTDRPCEEVFDVPVQNGVGRQADRVGIVLRFEERIDLRVGESRVATEEPLEVIVTVSGHHRLEHRAPGVSTVDVAVTEDRPLHVAELVEAEQRVIAGAAEVAVVG